MLADLSRSCRDYFKEDAFDTYLTEYAFFNVNTANESMLYNLYELRTGNKATSTPFAVKVRNQRRKKKFFSQNDLKTLLSTDLDTLYPFISALPEMNVNTMNPDLLKAVLTMGKKIYKVPLKGNPWDVILSLREGTEITEDRLAALISAKFSTSILASYLGCRTWFWNITVKRDDAVYQAVVMRVPPPPGEKDKGGRFKLVTETFTTVRTSGTKAETEMDILDE
jgi:hypothetical protein